MALNIDWPASKSFGDANIGPLYLLSILSGEFAILDQDAI
jgi:hypothetical protein